MNVEFYASPWAAFVGDPGLPLNEGVSEISSGPVYGRLVGALPDKSTWNGKRPTAALLCMGNGLEQWDLPLPVGGDQVACNWTLGEKSGRLDLIGLSARVPEAAREGDSREQWLVWQLQRYAELSDIGSDRHGADIRLPWGARRSWESVAQLWRMGGDEAAELALIVRLALDSRFVGALRSIQRSPRRTLLRQHEAVKVSRIQEMDSVTLRAYSQAPGRNAVEKAGSKQELLAVVRRDTANVVENHVVRWVATRARRMADVYCKRNAEFMDSTRYTRVRSLGYLCKRLLQSPGFEEVGSLAHHLTAPTYCLQFERRYRHLWRVYGQIRRQDRLEDDAWQWQAHFWGTSTRLLLSSMLRDVPGWSEPRQSMAYIRDAGNSGEWVRGPSTPGPFATPDGLCHVIDLRNQHGILDEVARTLPREALTSGADWLLVTPQSRRVLCVWSAVATGADSTEADSKGLGLEALSVRMVSLSRTTEWSWAGLLFVAMPESAGAGLDYLEQVPRVIATRVPADVHKCWGDIHAGLELAIEELNLE